MIGAGKAAIRAYIDSNYSGLTIRWKNQPIPPERKAGQAYVEAEVIGGHNSLRAFSYPGNRLFIHPGLIRIYIMVPWMAGTDAAEAQSDVFSALLERKEIDAPAKPQIVRTKDYSCDDNVAFDEEGNFLVMMGSVPFDFYYLN